MAIIINTPNLTGGGLLAKILKEINQNKIRTWSYNPFTGFTHTTKSGEWNKGAYLKVDDTNQDPSKLVLIYRIEESKKAQVQVGTFGVLNGRFSEMIMNHFKGDYSSIELKDWR